MHQLDAIKADMQNVLGFTEFNPSHTDAEFDANTDKVACYGLTALVAGGIAAKSGLYARLVALIIAAKKLTVLAVVAVLGLFGKMFRRKSA